MNLSNVQDIKGDSLYSGSLKNGNGAAYSYHKNGVIAKISLYARGKILWVVHEQDENGKIREKLSTLKNGSGEVFIYGEDNEIKHKINYIDGVIAD